MADDILYDWLYGEAKVKSPEMHLGFVNKPIGKRWNDLARTAKRRKFTEADLLAGDVIYVERWYGAYEHFAVYVGHGEVIHYAPKPGEEEATVHRAPFSEFLEDSTKFYVCQFDKVHKDVESIVSGMSLGRWVTGFPDNASGGLGGLGHLLHFLRTMDYHLYTPEETVRRAESKLGEHEYDLLFNNCEHFAVWCKTGVSESKQVDQVLDLLTDWVCSE